MKTFLAAASLAFLLSVPAFADTPPEVGKPAPDFTGTDIGGGKITLGELKGKIVVLEWTNKNCPFVHKHYDGGNMQALQKEATDKGVKWISIVSSAPGNDGNVTPEEARKVADQRDAHFSNEILDTNGAIGHLYAAKTTPDMYVIDKAGILVYEGAIDDRPTTDKGDIPGATNYVRAALDSVEHGKPVETSVTVPYGCSVKY